MRARAAVIAWLVMAAFIGSGVATCVVDATGSPMARMACCKDAQQTCLPNGVAADCCRTTAHPDAPVAALSSIEAPRPLFAVAWLASLPPVLRGIARSDALPAVTDSSPPGVPHQTYLLALSILRV